MNFLTATHTDVGTRKKTNQDSMIIMQADTEKGNILFASVCDGMGGLAKGELASATMVNAFADWFEYELPGLLEKAGSGKIEEELLWTQWSSLIDRTSRVISEYGRRTHISLGTTAVAVLIIEDEFYTLNVGDSRVYLLSDNIYQLTKDQTYVQREMDAGRMTYEESLRDPQRSVLLQCIGASPFVRPVFSHGTTSAGQVFMLCCDGFRHVIAPEEFYRAFHPSQMTNEDIMTRRLVDMTRLNIERREDDNISAILVKLV
ncbi:MAG: serine/threonine-protein phosphatase [Eubacteriales bacterium]|nr:serine/threonine-protein phosphatase [Eubacteriales bacterium]